MFRKRVIPVPDVTIQGNMPLPSKKPAPIIEKIILSEEDTQEIQSLMDGKLPNSKAAYWKEMGKEHFIKHYKPMSKKSRLDFIKTKYFGEFCCICKSWPTVKFTYKLDGISNIERYCEKHVPT